VAVIPTSQIIACLLMSMPRHPRNRSSAVNSLSFERKCLDRITILSTTCWQAEVNTKS
jgi:hypothetical protein